MTDTEALRKQVAAQCRAVAHMASVISQVHKDKAKIIDGGHADDILDLVGHFTSQRLESLGNILNGMDAVTDEDDWIAPIIIAARERWPESP